MGTHLIAFCGDHGIIEVQAAGLMVTMGIFDLIGTTASGWLTDRFDPRKLLFMYYGLRGISLIFLPYTDFSFYALAIFAVFYGLDWIATVPPTLKLIQENFGTTDSAIIFGWVGCRTSDGRSQRRRLRRLDARMAGQLCPGLHHRRIHRLVAAVISLLIARPGKDVAQLKPAVA